YSNDAPWEWDGRELKQRYSNDAPWEWNGQELKKRYSNDAPWEVDGDAPIPILAVVIGIIQENK
ncbi:MAG: hypothetical protein LBF40_03225, partial [Deltaproteobacteria bacterium]|nr:hypothetical protein [Deltaproteobacteria bacterium]